ncbi:hypothetical protein F4679DRAFT_588045 [Xylaria curta]|nr:hypothetical protein F4679DRAFT_588045 [Xylaria curta]
MFSGGIPGVDLDPSEISQELYRLATVRDTEALQQLRRSTSQFQYHLDLALHVAVSDGGADIIEYLVGVGASVSSTSNYGHSLMHRAVLRGNAETIKCLLDLKAPVNLRTRTHGETPLLFAVDTGSTRIVKCLLNAKPLLELDSGKGETALHRAVWNGNAEMIECLLDAGADCTAKDFDSRTPWQQALLSSGRHDIIDAFVGREFRNLCNIIDSNAFGRLDAVVSTWSNPEDCLAHFGYNKPILRNLDKETFCSHFGLPASSYDTALDKICDIFVEQSEKGRLACVREATCTFMNLDDDHGTDFVSLCVPYLSSVPGYFLRHRWNYTLKDSRISKYCVTNEPIGLGADIEVTLDEYCNPSLSSAVLDKRNMDQVLTRYLQRKEPHLRRLVTVRQIWCWKVGSRILISCHNDLRKRSFRDRYGRALDRGWDASENLFWLLSEAVDYLDNPLWAELDESIFAIFSKSISEVFEEVNSYANAMRFEDISVEKERKFLHNINDIREEIAMMQTVLFQQEEIWKEFTYKTWPQFWPEGGNGRFAPPVNFEEKSTKDGPSVNGGHWDEKWRRLARPQTQILKFRRRFEKLDQDAERVEKYILVQLDLKQKHAALQETHTATFISAAVVGFTVITVIFTPLSFFTSLFALSIDSFQKDGNGSYATNYIGKWIATGEVVSLVIAATVTWLACLYFLRTPIPINVTSWLGIKRPAESLSPKEAKEQTSRKEKDLSPISTFFRHPQRRKPFHSEV